MKITESQLRKIIREEILRESELSIVNIDGVLYIVDDEGNKEKYHGRDFRDLEDGGGVPLDTQTYDRERQSYGWNGDSIGSSSRRR